MYHQNILLTYMDFVDLGQIRWRMDSQTSSKPVNRLWPVRRANLKVSMLSGWMTWRTGRMCQRVSWYPSEMWSGHYKLQWNLQIDQVGHCFLAPLDWWSLFFPKLNRIQHMIYLIMQVNAVCSLGVVAIALQLFLSLGSSSAKAEGQQG